LPEFDHQSRAESVGVASEALRQGMQEFNATLEDIASLPDRFRQLIDSIESVLKTTAQLRSRVNGLETSLASERTKATTATGDLSKLKALHERQSLALRVEEGQNISLREQLGTAESNIALLRHENTDLAARLSRMEPKLREMAVAAEATESEIQKLRNAKRNVDEELVTLKADLAASLSRLSERDDAVLTLGRTNESLRERNDELTALVASLQSNLNATNERLAQTNTAFARERNIVQGLRAENERLTQERREITLSFESKIDAVRSRGAVVEKLLEESRARLQEESRQLSYALRTRSEMESELSKTTLALEATRREAAELRSSLNAMQEAGGVSNTLLEAEVEARRRAEQMAEVLRLDNSGLMLKLETLESASNTSNASQSDWRDHLESRIAELISERDQLRAALDVARSRISGDFAEGSLLIDQIGLENAKIIQMRS